MNSKYRRFQSIVADELSSYDKEDLIDLSLEVDTTFENLLAILDGKQQPTLIVAFRLLEELGICYEGYDFIDKVTELVTRNKRAKTTAVINWIKRNSYERVRWNTYLDFCDKAEVDALDFWEE